MLENQYLLIKPSQTKDHAFKTFSEESTYIRKKYSGESSCCGTNDKSDFGMVIEKMQNHLKA
jgi:hypothetical protein